MGIYKLGKTSAGLYLLQTAAGSGQILLENFSGSGWAPGYHASGSRLTMDATQPIWSLDTSIQPDQAIAVNAGTSPRQLDITVGGTNSCIMPQGSGTVTSATGTTFTDSSKTWGANQFAQATGANDVANVRIISGVAAGQVNWITGNSANQLTLRNTWGVTPAAGDVYHVTYSDRPYFQILPLGSTDLYAYPNGYLQKYLLNGTWSPTSNRLHFWVKCSVNGPTPLTTDGDVETKCYIKYHADTAIGGADGGSGFYTPFCPNFYAGRWIHFVLDFQPNAFAGSGGNCSLPYDPEFQQGTWSSPPGGAGAGGSTYTMPDWLDNPGTNPTHFFDGCVRIYFRLVAQPPRLYNFDSCIFSTALWYFETSANDPTFNNSNGSPSVPEILVARPTVAYNGSAYEVNFSSPKFAAVTYTIKSSTASMKANGWASGTTQGTVNSQNSAYTATRFTTPNMAEQSLIYFGIQPDATVNPSGDFVEVAMSPTPAMV